MPSRLQPLVVFVLLWSPPSASWAGLRLCEASSWFRPWGVVTPGGADGGADALVEVLDDLDDADVELPPRALESSSQHGSEEDRQEAAAAAATVTTMTTMTTMTTTTTAMTNTETSTTSAQRKTRRLHDMLDDLRKRSGVSQNKESLKLRSLITSRRAEYLEDLIYDDDDDDDDDDGDDGDDETNTSSSSGRSSSRSSMARPLPPHPRKFLHYLAPKVPAIKHSPDVNLRIRSAKSDVDSGIAACIVSSLAQVCRQYDQVLYNPPFHSQPGNPPASSAADVTKDRRFEQLVECIVSGVNVRKRKREWLSMTPSHRAADAASTDYDSDEDEDEADAEETEGLNVRDACRAAWGLATLQRAANDEEWNVRFGGETLSDVLIALSLRVRELLLARVKQLKTGDLFENVAIVEELPEERLDALAEELAEDTAMALWTFAHVHVRTGLQSPSLFQACSSILCQDIVEARRKAQDTASSTVIGGNDVVDRLARSETAEAAAAAATNDDDDDSRSVDVGSDDEMHNNAAQSDTKRSPSQASTLDTSTNVQLESKDALIDWLSANEIVEIIWAMATHGGDNDDLGMSQTTVVLCETAFDRLLGWLQEGTSVGATTAGNTVPGAPIAPTPAAVTATSTSTVEVVDAATLLRSEAQGTQQGSTGTTEVDVGEDMDHDHDGDNDDDGDHRDNEADVDAPIGDGDSDSDMDVEIVTENLTINSASPAMSHHSTQEVEVVDAKKLLEAAAGGETVKVEREIVVTESDAASPADDLLALRPSDPNADDAMLMFTPSDLATVAWAVTELDDPLQEQIMQNVIRGLHSKGKACISRFEGGELSNLAWALAKYEEQRRDGKKNSGEDDSRLVELVRWIALASIDLISSPGTDSSLSISTSISSSSSSSKHPSTTPGLDQLQSRELGRLAWAMASMLSVQTADSTQHK